MKSLRGAIKEFRSSQAKVYREQPTRIKRDVRSARKSTKDHVNRWLFELIQNCDDEKAKNVEVNISENALYIADNGNGFKPDSVESISGTDFSEKPEGSIGRKGVGFKSVYQITDNPKIFSLKGEGLEFNLEKSKYWFKEKNLSFKASQIPYQWLPFYLSRNKEEENDPLLKQYQDWNTVIVLPFKSKTILEDVVNIAKEFPTYSLFGFNNIENIKFYCPDIEFQLNLKRNGNEWDLSDSRNENSSTWNVLKKVISPPKDIIKELDFDDQKHVKNVSFLIAAPFNDEGLISPTSDYHPLHVFYPTEVPSPVRLFLHAEFLVKNDRTALIPINSSKFNKWIGDKLAGFIVDFVNNAYTSELPASYISLLLPEENRQNNTTNILWENIKTASQNHLLLPNLEGAKKVRLTKSKSLNISESFMEAYKLACATKIQKDLIHESFHELDEVRQALSALGSQLISDDQFVEIISSHLQQVNSSSEFTWESITWLAKWIDSIYSHSQEYKNRKARIEHIPILPIQGKLHSYKDLDDKTVTWGVDENKDFPEWLPLVCLDEWLEDKLHTLEYDHPILKLLRSFSIKEYSKIVLIDALHESIGKYWDKRHKNPGKYIEFLLEQNLEEFNDLDKLTRCPVYARTINGHKWVPAEESYLGKEWNNKEIEKIFKGNKTIKWALPLAGYSKDHQYDLLRALNSSLYPKINTKNVRNLEFDEFPDKYKTWLSDGFNREYAAQEKIDSIKEFQDLDVSKLSTEASTALLQIIATYWDSYYVQIYNTRYRWIPRSREDFKFVDSFWFYQVKCNLIPPLINNVSDPSPLKNCWIPDDNTKRMVGDFLPIVDLGKFGNEKEEVSDWLKHQVQVRQSLTDVTKEEWHEIIENKIPKLLNNRDINKNNQLRDTIHRCYEASIDSLSEKFSYFGKFFNETSFLCHKGAEWSFKKANQIYLADDNELAKIYHDECWQIDFNQRYHATSKKIFHLKSLKEEVEVEIEKGLFRENESEEVSTYINHILPFVYVWRCSQSARHIEIKDMLTALNVKVLDELIAQLSFPGVVDKKISKDFVTEESDILLNYDFYRDKSKIALALANQIGVKTEADFYENLLRCNGNDNALRNKLISKGLTTETIERHLREFDESIEVSISNEDRISNNLSNDKKKKPQLTQSDAPKIPSSDNDRKAKEPLNTTANSTKFSPKNIETEKIVFTSGKQKTDDGGRKNSKISNKQTSTNRSSREDNLAIEQSGREAAEKKLKDLGYKVEQMPQENPGFDIKAIKNEFELRIEVKAHKSKAKSIDLTRREYEEYIINKHQEHVSWQLWNIENLSQTTDSDITITRYTILDEEALDSRSFSVNLNHCQSLNDEQDL